MVESKSLGTRIFRVFNVLVLSFIGFCCILPMWHTICASFSEPGKLTAHIGVLFKPLGFTLNGYKLVLNNPNIAIGYMNTILYVVGSTTLGLLLTVTSAYTLSRKRAYFRNMLMFIVAFTMMFNGGIIPYYMVIHKLGWIDHRIALIIPGCLNVFNVIIMRTSMSQIPDSLEEAARIDGASNLTILVKIVAPLSKATIAVVILFMAVGQWNSWFSASMFLQSRSLYPLQLILRDILLKNDMANMSREDIEGSLSLYKELVKYCTTVVATAPILCIYPFVQKHFVTGVMIGSIKG